MAAQEDAVGEVGCAALWPGVVVVGVAPGGGDGAALGAASAVSDLECFPLCACEEAAGPSDDELSTIPIEPLTPSSTER